MARVVCNGVQRKGKRHKFCILFAVPKIQGNIWEGNIAMKDIIDKIDRSR